MDEEMEKLNARGTFQAVDKPEGQGLIGLKWVFDIKYNADGAVKGVKARLVAQGFSQRPEDYDQTYMPTPSKETTNGVYSISAKWDHQLYTFDIKQAFTHSKIRSPIYCRQVPGYPEADPKLVLKLCVALYGLKQAAFEWYCLIFQVLVSIGLWHCELDHALFLGVWTSPPADGINMPNDGEPLQMLVPLHVDDGLTSTNSEKLYVWMIMRMKKAGIDVVDLGPASMYLAARILWDRANRRLWLSISPFIVNMLEDWKMDFCNAAKTPMDTLPSQMPDAKLGVLTEHMPITDFKKAYQSVVGSINYAAKSVRADLSFAAMVLGHHAAAPEQKHMAAAKRVLCYLWGTKDYVLMFDGNKDIDPSVNDLVHSATAFMDADWASEPTTRLSVSGFAMFYMGGLVSWSSVCQRTIVLSSTEAEYYAIVHAVKRALWFRLLLIICGLPVPSPFPIMIDNKSAIAQVNSPAITSRSKHIHIRNLFIKEHFNDRTFSANWVPSSVNVADIFTKPLSSPLFEKHHDALGIVSPPS
ncbi:hypothetical protein EST38_g13242 [Candolleomyces aberdarensis]|uniref:Reverse transcriptase Ty1/copia-type domain-containing protein n=1 Tax=Candolleomyces aberdarensis TaxID=2316362 RepID=A0A4Q2D0E8_9AGAR|nr:hypothetical protein EST38_g13242 [Candolleomyces aberdarensis]